ncbi:MAG TPA: hypothetical protein VFD43_06400 [Planctomycetota bacterium]|nr:hypothetical protein [Planctomycetota bacterium]
MPKKLKQADRGSGEYPDDWVVMTIGKPAPPGAPVGKTCVRPFEQIKHLLSDHPMARYGDPAPWIKPPGKRRRTKRRRA